MAKLIYLPGKPMKNYLYQYMLAVIFTLTMTNLKANDFETLQSQVQLNLQAMLKNIDDHYAYADNKNINWACLKQNYGKKIKQLKHKTDAVLYFEHLLLEFADSHMTLNTNTKDSYRLNAPISVKQHQNTFIIDDLWQTQLVDTKGLSIGAELIGINGMTPTQVIKNFPTRCLDKTQSDNQQWIINKALAGQYAKPRVIEVKIDGQAKAIDLDALQYHDNQSLIHTEINNGYGIIKINNSLGQTDLINAFDTAIDQLIKTQGMILDLRHTINGGDSYIARAIIGRFIDHTQAYQKHRFEEHRNGGPKVARLWTEFVDSRGATYKKPLVVLVNRWTGSMGEGLTIGLHGMQRGHIMGSQMAGLLGAVYGFQLEGLGFGYQMPAEQLFHVDGTPREQFVPDEIIKPINTEEDAVLRQAIDWLKQQQKQLKTL